MTKRINIDRVIAIAGVLCAFLALAKPWNWFASDMPSLGRQLEDLRREEARSKRSVRLIRKVQLRDGTPSYVVVTTPETIPIKGSEIGYQISDELDVYDTQGENLETNVPAISLRPHIAHRDCRCRLAFNLIAQDDFNADGLTEIVGTFSVESANPIEAPIHGLDYPFVLYWAAPYSDYRLVSLLPHRPEGLRFTGAGEARRKVALYQRPVTLFDPESGDSFEGYGAEGATLARAGSKTFLMLDFTVRDEGTVMLLNPSTGGFDAERQITSVLHGLSFLQTGDTPSLFECVSTELNLLGPIVRGELDKGAIRKIWLRFRRYTEC